MTLATKQPVLISNGDFEAMLTFSRLIDKLQTNEAYIQKLMPLPEAATIIQAESSMLMGYDFHLTEQGPKLIEINNNAGGLWEADSGWIPQFANHAMLGELNDRIAAMFPEKWQHIAILDEDVSQQFMFPEMQAYGKLLQDLGRKVSFVSPEELVYNGQSLLVAGEAIDAIYNRHTDFYLLTPEMSHIAQAFMAGHFALNPYPRSYALVGDKNRMVDWWRPAFFDGVLEASQVEIIKNIVPETHIMAEVEADVAWSNRARWVFKPAALHGGKGVLMGKSISRTRFERFDAPNTVMQQLVPPSTIAIDERSFKFDLRLYMCGQDLIAMAGRAWNGQITNFKEEGSGWTAIQVADKA